MDLKLRMYTQTRNLTIGGNMYITKLILSAAIGTALALTNLGLSATVLADNLRVGSGGAGVSDISKVHTSVNRTKGRATVIVTYKKNSYAWQHPDQSLSISLGPAAPDGWCQPTASSYLRNWVLVSVDFPAGQRWINSDSGSVTILKMGPRQWRYTVVSPLLKESSTNCAWVAVGDAGDWEWFVNGGAFMGALR
jgi:hypothetical protein